MWQFGCLLYVLCTGFSLFTVDNQENVRPEELHKIAAWDDEEKAHKMASIGKGWPRRLISSLLSRDPQQRPRSWDYVLKQLGVQKSSRKAVNTRACSVYHLTDVLRPACDAELEKRLAGIGEPLEGMLCVEDGKIWCQLCQLLEPEILVCRHMVNGYTKGACMHHMSSYTDALDLDGKGPDHVGDADVLLSYSW